MKKLSDYEYYRTELGVLYCADCLDILPLISDNSVDLVLTSPPYDNLRDYQTFSFDFKNTSRYLYEKLIIGGTLVWVVNDSTIDGNETGTSFIQALAFKNMGFNLYDTMIYLKDGSSLPHENRYNNQFEFMFVFLKGKIKTTNIIKDKKSKYINENGKNKTVREKDGKTYNRHYIYKGLSARSNVWLYSPGYMKTTQDVFAYEHPAMLPEQLSQDHIISWSNPGDLVLDCFMGSGTTGKMCEKLNRRWIGIEISEKYCEIAKKRISQEANQLKLFK
jgi:DNA modification methylase